jgi:hypothetical protein
MNLGMRNAYKILVGEPKEMGDKNVSLKIILKWVLNECN